MSVAPGVDNLARIINRYLQDRTISQKFLVRVRIPSEDDQAELMYRRYLEFKMLCNYHTDMHVVLWVDHSLPSENQYMRYWGEQVHAVQINSSSFIKNQKGYPVLSQRHQAFLKTFMRSQCVVILRPNNHLEPVNDFLEYITRHLFANHDKLDKEEMLEVNFRNYIQSPL